MIWILYGKCTKISIYCTKKYIIYELLLEGREGAGEMGAGAGKALALFAGEMDAGGGGGGGGGGGRRWRCSPWRLVCFR